MTWFVHDLRRARFWRLPAAGLEPYLGATMSLTHVDLVPASTIFDLLSCLRLILL
jgi:hypothetical protein